MLKIVLIDDEMIALKGMMKVLSRRENTEILGSARDGQTGLELIKREKPDLVLTDIRMPGMSGLDMIQECQKIYPDILFVIFSGFNEFKFVQKAIRMGVIDYLEKPVTIQQLENTLNRAADIIEYKRDYKKMKQNVKDNSRIEIERLLSNLINHPEEMQKKYIDDLLTKPSLIYSMEIVVLCVGKIKQSEDNTDKYRKLIHEMTYTLMGEHTLEIYTVFIEQNVYFVYFNQECQSFPFGEKMKEIKNNLEDLDIQFYGGMSSIGQSVYDLNKLFTEARNALKYAEYLDSEVIIQITDVDYKKSIPLRSGKDQRSFEFNFRIQNYKECKSQIIKYLESLRNERLMPELLRNECIELLKLMQCLIDETGQYEGKYKNIVQYSNIFDLSSEEGVIDFTIKYIQQIFEYVEQRGTKRNVDIINQMKQFINCHYAENLSLTVIADEVHMNATYLSMAFRKEEGITYSNYLAQIRIDNAKVLLAKGEKAKDVCEKVGYHDYRYFNKQFKKYVGMTPDTYKKMTNLI